MLTCKTWIPLLAAVLLVLPGCYQEESGVPDEMTSTANTQRNKPEAIMVTQRDLAAMNEAVTQFVAALAGGDLDKAKAMYLPQSTFDNLFAPPEADAENAYESRKQLFAASVDEVAGKIGGSQFQNLEYDIDHPTTTYPQGATLHDLPVRQEVMAMNDLRVTVAANDREQRVLIPLLIRHDGAWYLAAPIQIEQ